MSSKMGRDLTEKLMSELEPAGLVAIDCDGNTLSKSVYVELYATSDGCVAVRGNQVLKMIESGIVDCLRVYNMNMPNKFLDIGMECGPVHMNVDDTITYKDPGLTEPLEENSIKDMAERALKILEEIQDIMTDIKRK